MASGVQSTAIPMEMLLYARVRVSTKAPPSWIGGPPRRRTQRRATAAINPPPRPLTIPTFRSDESIVCGKPPNESRLSCGALKKESPFLKIYARRQLQALVRRQGEGEFRDH